jgi:hypothetical protein
VREIFHSFGIFLRTLVPLAFGKVTAYAESGGKLRVPLDKVPLEMISLRLYTLVLGAIGVALASYALLRRKPKSADDVERERRTWLNTIGRITDGTVIDVQEIDAQQSKGASNRPATMLIYQYDVAGVSYEASQDVTYLRQWINLHSCRLGLPTSVKYDARNPGNSMVIAEGWIGLRQ